MDTILNREARYFQAVRIEVHSNLPLVLNDFARSLGRENYRGVLKGPKRECGPTDRPITSRSSPSLP